MSKPDRPARPVQQQSQEKRLGLASAVMNSTYYVELDCLVQEAGNELLANQVDFLKSTEMLAWGLAFLAIILALAAVLVHGAFWASMAFLIIDVPVTALTFLLRRALPGKARIMVQKKKVGQLYRTMA